MSEKQLTIALERIATLEADRDELNKVVNKLMGIMQYKPGAWSDASRLRSLANTLIVPDPNDLDGADIRAAREASSKRDR